MKIFPVSQVVLIDSYTIEHEPVKSIDLMERASIAFYKRFVELYPHGDVTVLVGPGNNGGDALALSRMLWQDGRHVDVWIIVPEEKLSVDAQENLKRLKAIKECVTYIESETQFESISTENIIIDGLFGSGLNRPLTGMSKALVKYINSTNARVVSIDIPSGLYGENNTANDFDAIMMADYTISFQFPKLAFMFAEHEHFVGEWFVEHIGLHPDIIHSLATPYCYTDRQSAQLLLQERSLFAHKGHCGHALLIAGSYGKMGAAILAAQGCLRSGAGLLTAHVPRLGYSIIQTAVPEAMASIDRSDILVSEFPDLPAYSAIGVGPGIGTKPNTHTALKELLVSLNGKPLVLDADALNILACDETLWESLPPNAILTPHPGEFDRLAGPSQTGFERLQKAIQFAQDMQVVLVLKGAYTAVISADGQCYFNSTGNAGMATAGSGDVLTGVLLSLLAQGYEPLDAARLGCYLHGLSADLLLEGQSQEGIVATDIISKLGAAFHHLRR